jgi:hypothetical protein
MKNKIFFSFLLSVFFSVMASEKPMTALVKINKDVERYNVMDVRKIDTSDSSGLGIYAYYEYPKQVTKEDMAIVQLATSSDKMMIKLLGDYSNQFSVIEFTGDSFVNLKKELKEINEIPQHRFDIRTFYISLMDAQHETKGVSFYFDKKDFQQIMSHKSYVSQIVAVFGFAGLVALIYYFDLHSKGMELLGRG